jgi:iron(III) transport system substrate-binding protein
MNPQIGLKSLLALALLTNLTVGCKRDRGSAGVDGPVVLYTSVDEPYVRPLVEQFQKQTGIEVTLVTDAEASKSVGLSEKLRAEKDHPQADVWWDNECFLTINMADEGILEPYASPSANDIPESFKDRDHRWAASVLRVRMLVSAASGKAALIRPSHIRDLLRPELKNHIAIARPTAGTTGGHVAALYVLWGKDRAEDFFHGLHDNGITLVGGNSVVAESVARGDIWAGICDNDDAADASANVGKLEAVLPDQGDGDDGTLAIPCMIGLVAHGPHPAAAKRLIDYLLSQQVDRKLIQSHFAWCSTRDALGHGRFTKVDYITVAKAMPAAIRSATAILEGR